MPNESAYDLPMATDKAKLMVYMDQPYKEGLAKLAAAQNRSMSNYVETLIIEAVEAAIASGEIPSTTEEDDKK
ncbi:MAG TPA: hypothetical protein VEZ50_17495 [Nodosilinea sp.]|nr:hypothetical protein [Nodosilinea sp.]